MKPLPSIAKIGITRILQIACFKFKDAMTCRNSTRKLLVAFCIGKQLGSLNKKALKRGIFDLVKSLEEFLGKINS